MGIGKMAPGHLTGGADDSLPVFFVYGRVTLNVLGWVMEGFDGGKVNCFATWAWTVVPHTYLTVWGNCLRAFFMYASILLVEVRTSSSKLERRVSSMNGPGLSHA